MTQIGLIGAGVMGLCAAERLLSAGHTVAVSDISAQAREKAGSLGASVVEDARGFAEAAEFILMYLPGPSQVEACVLGPRGILPRAAAGAVIIDQSTVDPDTSRRMSLAAAERGIGYLDAPVLGRPSMAGKWTLPVGGSSEAFEKCRPVLQHLAAHIFHLGPSGSGNQVKLLNQLMFGAINAVTAEVMAIAGRMGIEPRLFYETIAGSNAGTVSNLFKELGARICEDRYAEPTFSVDLLEKDVHLAVDMARRHGAPPLISRTVEFLNEAAKTQGFGSLDTSVMWKCYSSIWGGRENH